MGTPPFYACGGPIGVLQQVNGAVPGSSTRRPVIREECSERKTAARAPPSGRSRPGKRRPRRRPSARDRARRPGSRSRPRAPACPRRGPPARRARRRPRRGWRRARARASRAACRSGSGKGLARAQVSPPTRTAEREPSPRPSMTERARRSNLLVTTPQATPAPSSRVEQLVHPGEEARVHAQVPGVDGEELLAQRGEVRVLGRDAEGRADHAARALRDVRPRRPPSGTGGRPRVWRMTFTVRAMSGAVSASVPSRSNRTARIPVHRSPAAARRGCSSRPCRARARKTLVNGL